MSMDPLTEKSGPILGIDPGLDTTGYGVLEIRDGHITIREAGVKLEDRPVGTVWRIT